MTAYRLAIVGSRSFQRLDLVRDFVNRLSLPNLTIVSGGAYGVDQEAERAAKARSIPFDLFPVTPDDWRILGKRAGPIRNRRMVETCDGLCAFYDLRSRGTADAIAVARQHHLHIRVFGPEGETIDPKLVRATGGIVASLSVSTQPDPEENRSRKEPAPGSKGRGASRRRFREFERGL